MKMGRLLTKLVAVPLSFTILSGCSNSDSAVASKMIDSIEEKNYGTAEEIYERALAEATTKEQEEINQTVSNTLQDYLKEKHKQLKDGDISEANFYNTVTEIEALVIDDKDLSTKIESYKRKKDVAIKDVAIKDVAIKERNVYTASDIMVAIEEKDYEEATAMYQETITGISEDKRKKFDQSITDTIKPYIEGRYAKIGHEADTEAAIVGMLKSILENNIGGNTLASVIDSYLAPKETTNSGGAQSETIIEAGDLEENSPYTEEELNGDPQAPSTNPNDYNENGEYVPADGPSDNPEDYNSGGEYKPVEDMTQEEIEAELGGMLEGSLVP